MGCAGPSFSAAFVWKTPGEGPPEGGRDLRGVYLPTKGHTVVALLRTLVLSPDLSPPLTWRAYRSSVKVVHTGGVRGDEYALRSLGIFDDRSLLVLQRVASGKSIGELITNPLGG